MSDNPDRVSLSRFDDTGWEHGDAEFVIIGSETIELLRESAMPEWIRQNGQFERHFAMHVVRTAALVPVVLKFSSKDGQQQATVMSVDDDDMLEPYKTLNSTHIVIPF